MKQLPTGLPRGLVLAAFLSSLWVSPLRAGESSPRYSLSAGDRVRIEAEALDMEPLDVRLPPDGKIMVPGVGEISALGKTTDSIRAQIVEKMTERGFVGSPGIAVNVVEFSKRRVFLLQGVRTPGAYDLPIGESIRLTQALSLGGGMVEGISRGALKIYRERPDGRLPAIIRFDLSEILVDGRVENDIKILPGDTVILSDSRNPDGWIYVGGAVQNPGRYPFLEQEPVTALRAILAAGGFSPNADPSAIRLLRMNEEGQEVIRIDLRAAIRSDPTKDVRVVAGDTLVVPGGVF